MNDNHALALLCKLAVVLLVVGGCCSSPCPFGYESSGGYDTSFGANVTWVADCTRETITLTGVFPTPGWVSFGWKQGDYSMPGADVAFAWIDETGGQQYLYDATNSQFQAPIPDTDNYYTDASVSTLSGVTTLTITRAWNTTDPQDVAIGPDVTPLFLFIAMCTTTPTDNNISQAKSHFSTQGPWMYSGQVDFFAGATPISTTSTSDTSTGTSTSNSTSTSGTSTTGTSTSGTSTTGTSTTTTTTTTTTTAKITTTTTTAKGTTSGTTGSAHRNCPSGSTFTGNYTNSLNTWNLTWIINCDQQLFSAVLAVNATGWIAFGLNDAPQMIGTDALQASVNASGYLTYVNAHAVGKSQPVQDPTDSYFGVTGNRTTNSTTISFKRKLDVVDFTGRTVITSSNLVWAYHNTNPAFNVRHSQRGAVGIDFFTGETTSPTNYVLIHGSLMLVAFGLLAPAGSYVARFMKDIGHSWYRIHIGVQYTVLALTIASFVIIENFLGPLRAAHFGSVHSIIGLIIVGLTFSQVALGVLSNHLYKPNRPGVPAFPDKSHWWLGRLILLASIVNIFLGFGLYGFKPSDTSFSPYIAFGVWIGVSFIIMAIVQALRGQINHVNLSEYTPIQADNRRTTVNIPVISFWIYATSGIIIFAVILYELWK